MWEKYELFVFNAFKELSDKKIKMADVKEIIDNGKDGVKEQIRGNFLAVSNRLAWFLLNDGKY